MEIESSADNLVNVYKDDLEHCFGNELVQCVAFSNEFLKDADERVKCSFPNVEIALRMYGHELQWRAFVLKAEIH